MSEVCVQSPVLLSLLNLIFNFKKYIFCKRIWIGLSTIYNSLIAFTKSHCQHNLFVVRKHLCTTWVVMKKKSWQLIGRFLAFFCQERLTITWRSSSTTMKNMGRDNSHKTYIDFINFMLCLYMYLLIKKIYQKLCSLWVFFFFSWIGNAWVFYYFPRWVLEDHWHTGVIGSDYLIQ